MNRTQPIVTARPSTAVSQAPAAQQPPNFDALAASFGALSVAIAVGSAIVGVLAILITLVWNNSTKTAAIAAARDEAERRVGAFLRDEALPRVDRVVREHLTANMTNSGVVSAAGTAAGSFRAQAVSDPFVEGQPS